MKREPVRTAAAALTGWKKQSAEGNYVFRAFSIQLCSKTNFNASARYSYCSIEL
jgi:hypothetical protein